MKTRPETFVPFVHCSIDDTLSQVMPDTRRTLFQFSNVMNSMSVANVSVHASTPKEDSLAFNVTQEHTHTHTLTYTYQRYIVGKVHCGENPCVLVGRCGERTPSLTHTQLNLGVCVCVCLSYVKCSFVPGTRMAELVGPGTAFRL